MCVNGFLKYLNSVYCTVENDAAGGKWLIHFCVEKACFRRWPKYPGRKWMKVTELQFMCQANVGTTIQCALQYQSIGWLPASQSLGPIKTTSLSVHRCTLHRSHSWEWQEWLTKICSSLGQCPLSPYKPNQGMVCHTPTILIEFLTLYSLSHNPIEDLFIFLSACRWKIDVHCLMSLLEAMDAACEDIKAEAWRGWLCPAKWFFPLCIARHNFMCEVDEINMKKQNSEYFCGHRLAFTFIHSQC